MLIYYSKLDEKGQGRIFNKQCLNSQLVSNLVSPQINYLKEIQVLKTNEKIKRTKIKYL